MRREMYELVQFKAALWSQNAAFGIPDDPNTEDARNPKAPSYKGLISRESATEGYPVINCDIDDRVPRVPDECRPIEYILSPLGYPIRPDMKRMIL